MPELSPIPSAQRPSEPGYQPVSGYAVAAAVAAGLFVILLLFLVVAAIQSRRSPLSYEVLILAAAGWILAFIARSHIRNAEGTRTGLRLANAAWWVSILGGAAFFGYIYANELVLEKESARYANAFFKELKDGRPYHAFVYLLPPEERDRGNPNAPESFEAAYNASGYPFFKNHELTRLILRNGSDVEFEHVGVKDLGQVSAGFQATHMYRLTCPEGLFDVQVKLVAAEARKGSKSQLQWRIPADPMPNMSLKLDRISAYGRLVTELEQEGVAYGNSYLFQMSVGRPTLSHLMTTPLGHRNELESAIGRLSVMGGAAAALFPLRPDFLPPDRRPSETAPNATSAAISFVDLSRSGFFRMDDAGTPLPAEKLDRLRALWTVARMDAANAVRNIQGAQVPPDVPVTIVKPDKITVVMGVELMLESPILFARGAIGIECTEPQVLAALAAARARGSAPDDLAATLRSLPPRGWRVAWLRTDMEANSVMSAGPGMMPPR